MLDFYFRFNYVPVCNVVFFIASIKDTKVLKKANTSTVNNGKSANND